jgi:6,7-dimethyl-8-ribityllumazine synthase
MSGRERVGKGVAGMLKKNRSRVARGEGYRYAIVASEYNRRYVAGMLREARVVLARSGAARVSVVRVPGAFEIPVAVARLAAVGHGGHPWSAILCLGVILRGETAHAQQIGEAVSGALMRIQVDHQLPVVHEVLLLENEEQARVRCLGREHNRGGEAASTAVRMAQVLAGISGA